MGEGQCWAVQGDEARCAGAALPGSFFCSRHRHVRTNEVSRVWRDRRSEMPPDLVAVILYRWVTALAPGGGPRSGNRPWVALPRGIGMRKYGL